MVHPALVAGGALAGLKAIELIRDVDHDHVIKQTVQNINSEAPGDTNIYADHISNYQNPRTALQDRDLKHIPDVVVHSGSATNLIIEVETEDSIKNAPSDAESQLGEFCLSGYRSVLVVPADDADTVTDFQTRINESSQITGEIFVETPNSVAQLL
jgi:hypothetical protein